MHFIFKNMSLSLKMSSASKGLMTTRFIVTKNYAIFLLPLNRNCAEFAYQVAVIALVVGLCMSNVHCWIQKHLLTNMYSPICNECSLLKYICTKVKRLQLPPVCSTVQSRHTSSVYMQQFHISAARSENTVHSCVTIHVTCKTQQHQMITSEEHVFQH